MHRLIALFRAWLAFDWWMRDEDLKWRRVQHGEQPWTSTTSEHLGRIEYDLEMDHTPKDTRYE